MAEIEFGSEYSRRPIPGQTALDLRAAGEANDHEQGAIPHLREGMANTHPCGFCGGRPVRNAATWTNANAEPFAPCPRCGN